MALHWLQCLNLTSHLYMLQTCAARCDHTGHLIIDSEAGSFFFIISSSPLLKLHLAPRSHRWESGRAIIGRGGEQGDEASWNRICWLGSAPTAGNVFPFHSPLKRRRTESVFVQECSNSLRDSPRFYPLLSVSDLFILYDAVPEFQGGVHRMSCLFPPHEEF